MRPLVLRPHSMSRQKHTTHKSFTSLLRIHVFTLLHLYRKQSNEIFPPASYTALSRIRHLVAISSYQPLRQISTPYPSNNGFNKQAFSKYSYTHPSPTQRAKAPTNTDQFRFEAKTPPKRQSFTHTHQKASPTVPIFTCFILAFQFICRLVPQSFPPFHVKTKAYNA